MAEAKAIKARFVGDPRNPGESVPDAIEVNGLTFEAGKFTEVPADKADKFIGNDHFEVQGAKKPAAPEPGEATSEFAERINAIEDRAALEDMAKGEKRAAASAILARRLGELPEA